MKRYTIAISAGHTPKHPGAQHENVSEYSLTTAIVGRCCQILSEKGHFPWLIGAGNNFDQIKRINEIQPACGFELHFNSFKTADMFGTETLHAGSTRGEKLAQFIQASLLDRLGTRNRGTKKGYYQGDWRNPIIDMLTKTNCPFVIPEPLFLSHPEDFSRLDSELIAVALCDGIEMYLQTIK
jgi:N-acetylmuramoyl-L-alanine amidase